MHITVSNHLTMSGAPEWLLENTKKWLTFENPAYLENESMGRSNYKTPQYLEYYQELGDKLIVPRAYVRRIVESCEKYNINLEINDMRHSCPDVSFNFSGSLKPFQQEAVSAMLSKDFGTLSAPTGTGKTVMALYIVAQRKQPALIIVHTKELALQWIDRIATFLKIPKSDVGFIGNGKIKLSPKINVALVQTLYKCKADVAQHIGHVVVDECHRAPSRTFTEAISAFSSKYALGLSATPYRRDGLSKLIYWYVGDTIHKIDKDRVVQTGDILDAEVVWKHTGFYSSRSPVSEYPQLVCELTQDRGRNRGIVHDIAKESVANGGICLVLSDRKQHCLDIQEILLNECGHESEVLTGDLPARKRVEVVDRLNAGDIKIVLATGQLIGEGFDCKGFSSLFLVTPIKFSGRLIQYLGRILRPAPGKQKPLVYDYVDSQLRVFIKSANARRRVYSNNSWKQSTGGH